jgi:hypothetical protein
MRAKKLRRRLWLGLGFENIRELFYFTGEPTLLKCNKYYTVIGPFRSKAGAIYMRDRGENNPHCNCVADAERLSRLYNKPKEPPILGN